MESEILKRLVMLPIKFNFCSIDIPDGGFYFYLELPDGDIIKQQFHCSDFNLGIIWLVEKILVNYPNSPICEFYLSWKIMKEKYDNGN